VVALVDEDDELEELEELESEDVEVVEELEESEVEFGFAGVASPLVEPLRLSVR